MIGIDEAKEIAEEAFPKGPEAVAEKLGVRTVVCNLSGCDGWCIRCGESVVIRINQNSSGTRQRFTLAHELAHLLLGMPPDILPSRSDPLLSNQAEEKRSNQLASELLLPRKQLERLIPSVPVDGAALKKVAKTAEVSEVMAACRVANLAAELGLVNAAVIWFEKGSPKWKWSTTLNVNDANLNRLLERAQKAPSGVYRGKNHTEDVVVASCLGSPLNPILFLQLLPPDLGNKKSMGEVIKEAGATLFEDDEGFRNQLNGKFGSFKPKALGLSLDEAVEQFNERYRDSWSTTPHTRKFSGSACQKYIKLRLSEWCAE